jgi:hypothetical protein
MLRKISRGLNPRVVEKFFFTNSSDEWGEGNVLEPSIYFGLKYEEVLKEASRISDGADSITFLGTFICTLIFSIKTYQNSRPTVT